MLKANVLLLGKLRRTRGVKLMGPVQASKTLKVARRETIKTSGGESVLGRGKRRINPTDALEDSVEKMEYPMVWIWHPWRKNPEPPSPSFPCPNALKNVHGAIFTDLTPVQKKRQNEMMYGASIPPTRKTESDKKHPLLARILSEMDGQPKGFPFWYKRYPTRRHAYETRFNIPKEMLEGYPPEVIQSVSANCMSTAEKMKAEKALYIERYAQHDLDTTSPAVQCVMLALDCRNYRNHLLTNPHNNIIKMVLAKKEMQLGLHLRRLRKIDFRKYWEILRDHDVQDLVQPHNAVSYRWGQYWRYEWNSGLAINTNIPDFMDPRGLNGCVETGRSRAEVARDLGLTYTRTLDETEKKQLDHNAKYFERLVKFKTEQPEAWRERERNAFVRKFSGMFIRMNFKSTAVDFPSRYRKYVGTRMLRWRSARHGPA